MAGSSEIPDSLRMLDSINRLRGQDWVDITPGHISDIRKEVEVILKLDRKASFLQICVHFIVYIRLSCTYSFYFFFFPPFE